jgi:hypothetical protein
MARPTAPYIYHSAPRTGTVHLVPVDPYWGIDTLCGRSAVGMVMRDESASGIAATCNVCRKAAGLPAEEKNS